MATGDGRRATGDGRRATGGGCLYSDSQRDSTLLEGNHRCGALIVSYLLAREHELPFVLTVDNAKAYFDPSTLIKGTRKTSFALLFKLPHLVRDFAQFLKVRADSRYLL